MHQRTDQQDYVSPYILYFVICSSQLLLCRFNYAFNAHEEEKTVDVKLKINMTDAEANHVSISNSIISGHLW